MWFMSRFEKTSEGGAARGVRHCHHWLLQQGVRTLQCAGETRSVSVFYHSCRPKISKMHQRDCDMYKGRIFYLCGGVSKEWKAHAERGISILRLRRHLFQSGETRSAAALQAPDHRLKLHPSASGGSLARCLSWSTKRRAACAPGSSTRADARRRGRPLARRSSWWTTCTTPSWSSAWRRMTSLQRWSWSWSCELWLILIHTEIFQFHGNKEFLSIKTFTRRGTAVKRHVFLFMLFFGNNRLLTRWKSFPSIELWNADVD